MNDQKWDCVVVWSGTGRVTIDHWRVIGLPRKSDQYTEFRLEEGNRRMCVLTSAIRTMELRPVE